MSITILNERMRLMNTAVMQSLEIMWKGMVSIFSVIIILTIFIYIINKLSKKK